MLGIILVVLQAGSAISAPSPAPPMDQPPLPWFQYNVDDAGRPTFLSKSCLAFMRSNPDPHIQTCVKHEVEQHGELIIEHNREEDKDSYEAAPEGRAAMLAKARESEEREIAYDHSIILQCEKVMSDERTAAKISGVVDMKLLHGCGLSIQAHQRNILDVYRRYRASGGAKSLAQIYVRTDPAPKAAFDY